MSRIDVENEYINHIFKNMCPFCLSKHANWKWKYKFFNRITFLCNSCNAEISFNRLDVEQNNYSNAIIIVKNSNKHPILRQFEGRKVNLMKFINATILPYHYRPAKYIEGKGIPDSCQVCDFGQNTNKETTICYKFGMEKPHNYICDQFSDSKLRKIIKTFVE